MKRIKLTLVLVLLPLFPILSQSSTLPDTFQIGKHTVAEWKFIVDTTWGEGLPTEDKLILFDRFWEAADKYYSGWSDNPVNWDSVKAEYRPEIEAGVSHGRFTGIINRMGSLLREGHSGAYNEEVFKTLPGPGVPLMLVGTFNYPDSSVVQDNGWFGATLTPLNDDELLVIRSVPDHPLGLEAGDIVLGYDGQAWKDLYPAMLSLEFPFTTGLSIPSGTQLYHVINLGSSEKSIHHKWLASAGTNWHFFDTLDFQKYGASDTLHAPTSLLEGKRYAILGNEQIPVEGIEFPGSVRDEDFSEINFLTPVIYGTIRDNSIGYMYYTHMLNGNEKLLEDAISDLADSDLIGIILDLRLNYGGNMGWEQKFNPIFNRNIDSCAYYSRQNDGETPDLVSVVANVFQSLSEDFLNKPIALLTGPGAISNGDYASYFIHTQPMTRSFGKGTNTAYTAYWGELTPNTPANFYNESLFWDFGYKDWYFQIAPRNFGRIMDGELQYFIHNGFEIDEEIWFTQEAAYNQKDNMVERAAEWIRSVAYADACSVLNSDIESNQELDPFYINTAVVNPENHSFDLGLKIFTHEGLFVREIEMEDNSGGIVPEIDAARWVGTFTPEPQSFYFAEISTYDSIEDSWLTYPGPIRFTNVEMPEIFPKTFFVRPGRGTRIDISLTNRSEISLVKPKLKFFSNDPLLEIKRPIMEYGQIIEKDKTTEKEQIFVLDGAVGEGFEIWVDVDIIRDGGKYWNDSILLIAQTVGENYSLMGPELKIYPNPMQEFCRVQISGNEFLDRIEVYDLSGRLVFFEHNIGASSFEFTKGKLEEGIYFLKVYADQLYKRKLVIQ